MNRCNTSLLIDYCGSDGKHRYVLIDVGKTFREQVLRWFTFHKIPWIDSVSLLLMFSFLQEVCFVNEWALRPYLWWNHNITTFKQMCWQAWQVFAFIIIYCLAFPLFLPLTHGKDVLLYHVYFLRCKLLPSGAGEGKSTGLYYHV